jgi:hypothetical protein
MRSIAIVDSPDQCERLPADPALSFACTTSAQTVVRDVSIQVATLGEFYCEL